MRIGTRTFERLEIAPVDGMCNIVGQIRHVRRHAELGREFGDGYDWIYYD